VDELTSHNLLKRKHLEGMAPEHTPLATVVDRSGAALFFVEGFNVVDHLAAGALLRCARHERVVALVFRNEGVGSFVSTFGYIDDLSRVAGSPFKAGGMATADLHTMRWLIPFQNASCAAWLFDRAEQAIAETANLPKGKHRERRYAKRPVKFCDTHITELAQQVQAWRLGLLKCETLLIYGSRRLVGSQAQLQQRRESHAGDFRADTDSLRRARC